MSPKYKRKQNPLLKDALKPNLVQTLQLREQGIVPTLAIVRVGEKEDHIAYERGAVTRCSKLGLRVNCVIVDENISQEELVDEIAALNQDPGTHGILVLRPLPLQIDDDAIRNVISHVKDVDGVSDISLAGVFTDLRRGYPPCTPQACIEILDHYRICTKGKKVTVVGRSLVVGRPLAIMMLRRDATVKVLHRHTRDLAKECRDSEILIVAVGKQGLIGREALSPGQVVIDVGINIDENGKLCGDVNTEEARDIVEAITPVPGGVGTVTTAVLAKHVVVSASRWHGRFKS